MNTDQEKWNSLKTKYKVLGFVLLTIGLLFSLSIVWGLITLLANLWDVSLTEPNCKDDDQCSALAWIAMISLPFSLGIGLVISVALGGFMSKIGAKAAINAFLLSDYPESWRKT